MSLLDLNRLQASHAPQLYAEVLCATGNRQTPYPAHYPAAALVCEFVFRDVVPSEALGATLEETQRELMGWEELEDLPLGGAACDHDHIDDVVRIMETGVAGTLRRSAHAQIFTSILLRSVTEDDVRITCDMMTGYEGLIESCMQERQQPRYIAQPNDYWNKEGEISGNKDVNTTLELASDVASLFSHVQPDTEIDGTKYYLNGEKQHALAHLHAIIDLERQGFDAIAASAKRALKLQIDLANITLPGVASLEPVEMPDIYDPEVWRAIRDLENPIAFPHAVKRLHTMMVLGRHPALSKHFLPIQNQLYTAMLNG